MKYLSIVLFSLFTLNSLGQENKFEVALQINTQEQVSYFHVTSYGGLFNRENNERDNYYSYSAVLKSHLTDQTFLRFKVGFSKMNVGSDSTYDDGNYEYSYSINAKQTNYHFALGIERHLITGKINLYVGFQLPVNIYGESKINFLYDYSLISTGVLWYYNKTVGWQKNGYSLGFAGLAGFSFNITKHLGVFAEYSFGIMYAKIGGDIQLETEYKGTSQINKTMETKSNTEFEKFGILEQIGSFGLSYKF